MSVVQVFNAVTKYTPVERSVRRGYQGIATNSSNTRIAGAVMRPKYRGNRARFQPAGPGPPDIATTALQHRPTETNRQHPTRKCLLDIRSYSPFRSHNAQQLRDHLELISDFQAD
ncbi:hypothetical protein J6590_057762 [Homalodisca vitripennis]|nr:hypothetical protein J6590_057762 [Homalodisca vitripennis]